jgi:hypothetical protein
LRIRLSFGCWILMLPLPSSILRYVSDGARKSGNSMWDVKRNNNGPPSLSLWSFIWLVTDFIPGAVFFSRNKKDIRVCFGVYRQQKIDKMAIWTAQIIHLSLASYSSSYCICRSSSEVCSSTASDQLVLLKRTVCRLNFQLNHSSNRCSLLFGIVYSVPLPSRIRHCRILRRRSNLRQQLISALIVWLEWNTEFPDLPATNSETSFNSFFSSYLPFYVNTYFLGL